MTNRELRAGNFGELLLDQRSLAGRVPTREQSTAGELLLDQRSLARRRDLVLVARSSDERVVFEPASFRITS